MNDLVTVLLGLIGGLGIFLYGINLMGDGLQTLAGDKMKRIVEKLTNNIFVGIIVGMIVTAIIQSSSATTALSISLIRAGLMTMPQAIGIIMGANIGTTVTAFLFSFPAISDYSLIFVGIGAILIFFIRHKKVKVIGHVILGFGLLFYGLDLMGNGLKEVIKNSQTVRDILLRFKDYPLLGLMTGSVVTAIVQSSSATTGIVQSIVDTGELSLKGAIPIILGNNIGTTITAIIAALGGSIAAKRASLFHVLFNIFGSILFMIFLVPFTNLIMYLQDLTNASDKLAIAYTHAIFNITNALILVWFVKQIIWFLKKTIPGQDEMDEEYSDDMFNEDLIKNSPVLALESSKNAIVHMAHVVKKILISTINYYQEPTQKTLDEGLFYETIINTLDRKIHEYLVKITSSVDDFHSYDLSKYFDTIRDLERIGDHCENLLEVLEYIHENKGVFSEEALNDLNELFDIVLKMVESGIRIIETNDIIIANQVIKLEEHVDQLVRKSRKRHTIRVNEGICTSETGIMFVELLSNIERIADHCTNIAEYTINKDYYIVIDEKEVDLKSIKKVPQN